MSNTKALRLATVAVALSWVIALPFGSAEARFKVLYNFDPSGGGVNPWDSLIADSAGNLYGTTQGGDNNCWCGTVFKMTPKGAYKVLHSFDGGSDGAVPIASVTADASGNLYGTTTRGGGTGCGGSGCGIIFELAPNGSETILHTFAGSDGQEPWGALIQDANGNWYGTTRYGGAYGNGTVFELTSKGKESVLYSFTGGSDGSNPLSPLLLDNKGKFYGTTSNGGDGAAGTIFEFSKRGGESVLHSFTAATDGSSPSAALVADSKGNMYGVTSWSGTAGVGTVFKLSTHGTFSVLHEFGGEPDGANPWEAPLIMDASGNLYGTTGGGGSSNNGTVFKLTPKGKETILYSFSNGSDGGWANGGLVAGANGVVYGTTVVGGTYGYGVLYLIGQ